MRFLLALSALLLIPTLALAVDGVREVNQTCAEATGCVPGDTPGFPVTLSSPGSYVLTSDLAHDPALHGSVAVLTISTDDVTLDLNGFSIRSTSTCSIGSCPTGGVQGINASGRDRITVRNGRVVGVDANCVFLGAQGRVEGVSTAHCALNGFSVGSQSTVRDCSAVRTGRNGLNSSGGGTLYERCTFAENGLRGDVFVAGLMDSVGRQARASGPNTCDDDLCGDGRPRYYLTTTPVVANLPLTACDDGFHMASLWELRDTSNQLYDQQRGETSNDAGSGPVSRGFHTGWIRTGAANSQGPPAGDATCNAWANGSAGEGTIARLSNDWTTTIDWIADLAICNETHRVWCMED